MVYRFCSVFDQLGCYFNTPDLYRYFVRLRGLAFTLRIAPLHYLYHLYNGLSFLTGSTLHFARRWFGLRLPGSLPITPWQRPPAPKAGQQDRTPEHTPRAPGPLAPKPHATSK